MAHRKKTLEQLQAELKRAEERVAALRKQEQEETRAQKARDAKELLDAVRAWAETQDKLRGLSDAQLAKALQEGARRAQEGDAIGGAQPQEMPPRRGERY